MRTAVIGALSVIVLAGIGFAVWHFQGGLFRTAAPAVSASSWVSVAHPPGDRPQPALALIREFGAWHLSCVRQAQQPPKVGYIQNLGIVPGETQRPSPCHVFIMMRDAAAPGQTMLMNFRYRTGSAAPDLLIIYTTLGNPHVIYDRSGQVQDLSQRKVKWRGGFFVDPKHAPPGMNPQVQRDIPEIAVQFGRTSLTIRPQACIRGHCFGRLLFAQTAAIGSVSRIVVRLPGPPRGQPRVVDVPADGLGAALGELEQMKAS